MGTKTDDRMLVHIGEAARILGISQVTLRRWEKAGRFSPTAHAPSGYRLYELSDLHAVVRGRSLSKKPVCPTVCYARVSTNEQRDDLARQKDILAAYCTANDWDFEIISDIGSGMNYHKRGLRTLVRRIGDHSIGRLVLTDKDRLLRFGTELIFSLCEQFNIEVVVINATPETSCEDDLTADVLEILTVFSARMYGARSRRNRELIARLTEAIPEQEIPE